MNKKNIEVNKELIKKYPFLLIKDDPFGEGIASYDYEYTWWDEIPEGWAKSFGTQMCDELLEILKEADYVNKYQIVQIKEKYGRLCWYDNSVPKEIWGIYSTWLDKYEALSLRTCIKCGSPATHLTKSWIVPICDTCDN